MIETRWYANWKNVFWVVFFTSLLMKVFLAWKLPITGDEAYYIMWGKYPSLGYYDQPPMIGWLLSFFRLFGSSSILLRLPAILVTLIVAPGIVSFLKRHASSVDRKFDQNLAYQCGILYLLSPIHFLIMIISTDAPLIVFSFFCFSFFYRSIHERKLKWAAWAGIFFGLAFLSKYFVVLLVFSFFVYAVLNWKNRFVWKALTTCCLSALPFALIHLYWNYTHDWINFVFNIWGRNVGQGYNLENTKLFIQYQLYLIGPVLLALFVISYRRVLKFVRVRKHSLIWLPFLIPILAFGKSSLQYSQGFHWTLSFFPYLYLLAAFVFSAKLLSRAILSTIVYTAIHLAAVFILVYLPIDYWKGRDFYPGLQMYLHAPALTQVLDRYSEKYILAADGYTEASLFETFSPSRFHVFGSGVLFGRQDDLMTDFRELDGRNWVIFTRHKKSISEYKPYFSRVEAKEIMMDGRIYSLFLGKKFSYLNYRDLVLKSVKSQYYPFACRIMDRYF